MDVKVDTDNGCGCFMAICLFVLIVAGALLLGGCKATRVIEQVPVAVHDTVYRKMVQRDSVFVDRWHSVEVKGDTVFVTNEVTKTKVVTKTDTAYRYVERPITVTRTETVEVEKRLHWWQKGLMWMGVIGLVCLVSWIGIRIYRKKLS